MSQECDGVSIDDIHTALSHSERHHFLEKLAERDGAVDISEPEVSGIAIDSTPVRIRFHHIHLPMLEQYDFISWDKGTEEVTRGANFDVIEDWIDSRGHFLKSSPEPLASG